MKQTPKDKKNDAGKSAAPNSGKGDARPQDKKTAAGKAENNSRPRIGKRTLLLLIVGALALSAALSLIILSALGVPGGKRNTDGETTSAPAVTGADTEAPTAKPAEIPPADSTDEGPVVLTVGDRQISEAYYGYVYTLVFENAVNTAYQSMLIYGENNTGFDYSVSPALQTYTRENGETLSYDKYFAEETVKRLEYWTYYASYARSHGIALTEDQRASIDTTLEEMRTDAEQLGITLEEYLRTRYGGHVNEARLKTYLEEQSLAYLAHSEITGTEVAEPDLEALAKTPDPEYRVIDLRIFGLSALEPDAEARVAAMLDEVTDEASFTPLAKKHCSDEQKATGEFEYPDSTLFIGVSKATVARLFGEETAEEMFAAAAGKKFVLTETDGEWVYAIYVIRPAYFEPDPPVTVRHIFVAYGNMGEDAQQETGELPQGMTEENPVYSASAVRSAYKYANDVYQTYLSGEKTEDAFASLAEQYSHDTDSVGENGYTAGGLYTDLSKGYRSNIWVYSAALVDWAYNAARKPGDVTLIQSPYGFHIVYFVSRDEQPEWLQAMAEDARAEAMEAYEKTAEADYLGTAVTNENTAAAAANALERIVTIYELKTDE